MSIDFKPLLDLVTERPEERYTLNDLPHCPHCGSGVAQDMATVTTLLVGVIGIDIVKHPEQDPNHKWRSVVCKECGGSYCIESTYANVWVTIGLDTPIDGQPEAESQKERLVVRGLPSCMEDYVYHCAKCDGGLVRREYWQLYTDKPLEGSCLSVHHGVKQYRPTFHCDKCDERVITPFEYCYTEAPEPDLSPEEKEYLKRCREAVASGNVWQKMGPALGHTEGLARADFN